MEPLNLLCTLARDPSVLPHLCHHHPDSIHLDVSPYFIFCMSNFPPTLTPPAYLVRPWRWWYRCVFHLCRSENKCMWKTRIGGAISILIEYNILRMKIHFELKFNHLICHSLFIVHSLSLSLSLSLHSFFRLSSIASMPFLDRHWIRYKLCNELTA